MLLEHRLIGLEERAVELRRKRRDDAGERERLRVLRAGDAAHRVARDKIDLAGCDVYTAPPKVAIDEAWTAVAGIADRQVFRLR